MKRTPVFIISNARRFSRFFREDVLLFGNIPRACCVFISANTKELHSAENQNSSSFSLMFMVCQRPDCANWMRLFCAPQQTAAPGQCMQYSASTELRCYLVPDIAYDIIGVQRSPGRKFCLSTTKRPGHRHLRCLPGGRRGCEGDIQTANFTVYLMQQYDSMGQITGICVRGGPTRSISPCAT